MRTVIIVWIAPLVLFWGWYWLAFYDINFGYVIFSRHLQDVVFDIYGEMLGIDPATIPPLLARACVIDSALVACLIAFRYRRPIAAAMGQLRQRYLGERPASTT